MTDVNRWRGLKDLVRDTVQHGASAIERVHLATAQRPFALLSMLPTIGEPVRVIQQVHNAAVSTTYASVRAVTAAVATAADLALDAVEAAANAPRAVPTDRDDGPSQP